MFSRTVLRCAPAIEDVVAAFKVLGLTYDLRSSATGRPGVEDVRRQYREMARLHHPDLGSGDDNRMKVVNTAYELIQSSGVLQGAYDTARGAREGTAGGEPPGASPAGGRFARKAGTRRRRMPDDFANGDDASWSMKSSLDWQAMMNSAESVSEAEMKNPANHPFSHSKFFSFEDDLSIYRMIRGGATVRQVARTLGKPATFVERRLQNAQFKLRVQYVLRQDKRQSATSASGATASTTTTSTSSSIRQTTSTPITEAATRRIIRRSPYEDSHVGGTDAAPHTHAGRAAGVGMPPSSPPLRKREWEPTYPEWRAPRYRDHMTLEEQGRLDGLLSDTAALNAGRRGEAPRGNARHSAVSKMGRSYENYQRMRPAS
ncbi:DnaJ domain containing protein [Novymonas esmeraldas]|uniref:DnaJ domain containing protein n=1 Tax=Novymonas esmeraldas TaxID=1808958 RepID=A0AAW0F204_9TRYP